jgi:type III secretory pathway component EscS
MTDRSVIFIKDYLLLIIVSLKVSSLNMNALLAALVVATAGGILQIGGASWDITSHILRQPETFFTPSHTVLYAGAGLTTIAAIIGIVISLKNKEEIHSKSFYTAFKLLIIGAAIQLISGPGDFVWHSVFGVDGLMSPPHLALATGILINSIAAVIGLARILPHIQSRKNQITIVRAALVPAFAALWFSSIWYIFMFVLPLSNGQHFNFNPDPAAGVVIATIALPFLSAMIFLISAKTIGRLGAASAVAGVVISMNLLANIAPAYQSLGAFLPWQLLAIIPVTIGADIAIHRGAPRTGAIIAGALIGITFYIFNFPMLPMTFAELLNQPNLSFGDILPSMYATLLQVFVMTAVPSMLAGIVGAIIGSKRVQIPQIDVPISR